MYISPPDNGQNSDEVSADEDNVADAAVNNVPKSQLTNTAEAVIFAHVEHQ